jgi:hypothetical protein
MISKQKLINKLRAEGSKVYAEGYRIHDESGNGSNKSLNLFAEANKLYVEAAKLERITKWDWIRICIRGRLLEMFHPFATHKQHEDRANRAADKFMERKFGKNWRNE